MGKVRSKIKPIVPNGLSHGGTGEQVNRRPGLDPLADLGRGNAQGKSGQSPAPKRRRQRRGRLARPGKNDEFDEPRQFIRVAPLGQEWHVVRAVVLSHRRAGKTLRVTANGVDGVGHTPAFDFLVVDFTIGMAGQRQSQQTQSLFRGRERQVRFERGLRGGDEKEP